MFPFNQPDKTKDCGYRCLYYVLRKLNVIKDEYEKWLDNFRFFNPVGSGIHFMDICTVLDYHKVQYKFTQLQTEGLFVIYSGIWLHPEGKKHGHYFVYHHGAVLCSTHAEPYTMALHDVIQRLESKTVDHAFRCLQITGLDTK